VNTDLAAVCEAFNRHASGYDAQFARSVAGQAMRQKVWALADRVLPPGSRVLDLGCGTGEDAIHFAQRGIHVTAVDVASEMIVALNAKARAAGLADRIDARISDGESLSVNGPCDAIFSNFGAINCFSSLNNLRSLTSTTLRPGGRLILVSMGRFYPLETATFLMKADLRGAFRRFGGGYSATVEGSKFPVWYYSPGDLRRVLGDGFARTHLVGLRALLPAPGLEHLGRYFPASLTSVLGGLDELWTRFPLTASWADHYVSIWRRSV
jgi:SAM-dependent methyltransferase